MDTKGGIYYYGSAGDERVIRIFQTYVDTVELFCDELRAVTWIVERHWKRANILKKGGLLKIQFRSIRAKIERRDQQGHLTIGSRAGIEPKQREKIDEI